MDGNFHPPRYPAKVRLTTRGPDGNAVVLMSRVVNALRKAGCTKQERDTFLQEARSGDYENLKRTCERWVDVRWT